MDEQSGPRPRGWRATAKYLTYRGLGTAMGLSPSRSPAGWPPAWVGPCRGIGGPSLAMNERHMRRILAYECAEGVEPDPALVRRWSRRSYHAYARYWMEVPACPTPRPRSSPAA